MRARLRIVLCKQIGVVSWRAGAAAVTATPRIARQAGLWYVGAKGDDSNMHGPMHSKDLESGLREADAWGLDEFAPLTLNCVEELQSVVRRVHCVGLQKIGHLDKLLYMLARWGEGIKAKALEQFWFCCTRQACASDS